MNNFIKSLSNYLRFIMKDKQRRLNFILLSLIFIITPTQNYYAKLEIKPDRPVIREIDIELPNIQKLPINTTGIKVPYLTAKSIIALDVASKTLIFDKNPDAKIMPASTTKIMTALVSLEHWNLTDVLEVKNGFYIGQSMKLQKAEKITMESLLYGLLVASGNDAAYTLAENYPGGLKNFVDKMNEKNLKLNLNNTHFINPAGVEEEEHLTTAHDLAILASEAINNKTLLKIASTPEIVITDVSGEISHKLKNINELLGKIEGVKGLKTGWTEAAGECLITLVERDGNQVMFVVMNSQDRFGETIKLINWVFENFSWQIPKSIQN
ncbi:hypothetical protein A3J78_01455 [Candidatus Beckwithbacteria bacterium RBG_13_35_6]|uniref:Peptidase S11 D-alanyl-D-alanine carboxypeptidase A N-terminal domain-containing protein n=1 Tax=Candidatus Beckwithbacteria bacterium RBG_13_35_6 TaxID=1797456 RepID=A0A1F5DDE5_9BACT|nr:MAG: hypothetical protein A3J78_01455 [Candidatus Beckwithbacteria bacterium RBG_13_35_6]